MTVVVKSKEDRTGVIFRIYKDGKYYLKHKNFNNYFYVKTVDYNLHDEEFNKSFNYCLEDIKSKPKFTKIILSNNYMRKKLKTWWEDRAIKTYEADILANKRFLLDHKISLNNDQIPYAFYDIETDDRLPLEKDDRGIVVPRTKARILSYSRVDNNGEVEYFVLEQDNKESEIKLITSILNDLNKFGIVSGWYSVGFDMPYIKGRCAALGINIEQFDYINHIDYKELFIKYDKKSRPSYSLNAIANEILGQSKIDQEKGNGKIYETWQNNKKQLREYNIMDSQLIYEMNKKLMFIEVAMEGANNTGCHVINMMKNSDSGDYLLLRGYKKEGIIMRSKPTEAEVEINKSKGKIGGGYTCCFNPGFYNWTNVWDFASLYPSIMISFNISPETFIRRVTTESPLKNRETKDCIITPLDFENYLHPQRVFRREQGVVPKILIDLIAERAKIKYTMGKYKYEKLENGQPNPDYDPVKYNQLYKKQYSKKTAANCFHPNTKVLTEDGIKKITDLKVGEIVYSINPKTLQIEKKPILYVWSEDYKGKMFSFQHKKFKIRTTANHKFLVSKPSCLQNKFIKAEEFDGANWLIKMNTKVDESYKKKEIYIPSYTYVDKRHTRPIVEKGRLFDNAKLSELLGWFIAEGYWYQHNKRKDVCVNIAICQTLSANKENYNRIEALLKDLGLKYRKTNRRFIVSDRLLNDTFMCCGDNSYNKRIPKDYFDLFYLKNLFEGMYLGDGTKSQLKYSTKSKRLAVDVVKLCYLLGYKAGILKRTVKDTSTSYNIGFSKLGDWKVRPKNYDWEDYEGKVYNLTVADNHTLLAGENDAFIWCGQSVYGTLSFPYSRYYQWDLGDTITTCARATIKKCYEMLKESDCDGLGGDTDSIFVDLKGKDYKVIDKKFVSFLDQYTKNCGVIDNRLVFEHEKVFEKFLFVKKKNYAYLEKEHINIVGMEAIKSDSIPRAAALQKQLVHDLLLEQFKIVDWKALVSRLKSEVMNQELSIEDLTLTKALTKMPDEYLGPIIDSKTKKPKIKANGQIQQKSVPAHVKLAVRMMEAGIDVNVGSKIHYIVNKCKPIYALSIKEYKEQKATYQADYYWERIITPVFKVLFVAGFDLTEITNLLTAKELKTLYKKAKLEE